MKASELVLDYDLYPRQSIDRKHVTDIAEAIVAGVQLPPVVIDKKTKRVADGFHRTKATMQVHGEDAEIAVVEKSYVSDAELFLDAMRYNAGHGAKLDSADRTRCVLISERLSIPPTDLSAALHLSVDKLGSLRADRTATAGGLTIPIKHTIQHMAGRKLTKRQQAANAKLSGMRQVFYVNQVIELLEADLIDTTDESLLVRLRLLLELLGAAVGRGGKGHG